LAVAQLLLHPSGPSSSDVQAARSLGTGSIHRQDGRLQHEAARHRVGAVLWTCLVDFVFEWLMRLRHMVRQGRTDIK
jgi:hypothetical protein